MNEPLECPNCQTNLYDQINSHEDLTDTQITCKCGTIVRIYEDGDYGEWMQELIYHKDPNQVELIQ